jgi:uncharacterized protein YkwD
VNPARPGAPARVLTTICALLVALAVSAAAGAETAQACNASNKPATAISNKKLRAAIRCVVNKYRSNLQPDERLHDAAKSHSTRMRRSRCFSHQCSGEPALHERIRRTGYLSGASSYAFGETIAWMRKRKSARDVVRAFMGSPPHKATLLDGRFDEIGVGVSRGRRSIHYTIVVAYRRG